MNRLTVWCLAALWLCGCGANVAVSPLDAGEPARAAADSNDGERIEPEDAGVGDRFSIALSTSDCQGGCPMFDLKLNQSGAVEFNGRGNTRQQGWGVKSVAPEIAAEVLSALDAADYRALHDVYRTASDGCSEIEPDRSTHIWNVAINGGPAKIIVDYQGCQGVQEIEPLRQIPVLLFERLMLDSWLGRGQTLE